MRCSFFHLCLSLCLLLPFGAAQAADEPLAIVVAPAHAKALKKEDIVLIFKRKKLFWRDGSKIQPVNLPAANPYRRTFSQAILGATPEDLEKYWNDMYFHGVSPPYVVSSEEAVLRFVSRNLGAIGYVPFCNVDIRVGVALVIGASGQIVEDASTITCPR